MAPINECAAPGTGWIFCDDFESDRTAKYFAYDNPGGRFIRATGAGMGSSVGMKATYTAGPSSAGSLRVAFGAVPSTTFKPVDAGTAKYREIYWRFYARRESGWKGKGGDLTRAAIIAKSDRTQALIAPVWSDDNNAGYLLLDPASGTNTSGTLVTSGENDVNDMRWLGAVRSGVAQEDAAHAAQWACYEFHLKLNAAGQSDGLFEFSVDGQSAARKTGLNWVGSYNTYGINAVNLEQYTYDATAGGNIRTLDNFVVSTQAIGCSSAPTPPPPVPVKTVTVTPATSTGVVGTTVQLTAATKDSAGNTLTGRSITWSSANMAVATVNASGLVTLQGAGTATISATSEGVKGDATVTANVPVASVAVTPATASGNVGQTVQLTATTKDASGNTLTGRTIAWSSSNDAAASVSTSGLVTMKAAGSASITATSGGKTGTSAITVTTATSGGPNECSTPGSGWIFCDDFETDRAAKYFEYDNAGGKFVRASATGFNGSTGMRATYTAGQQNAGHLGLAFGRTPSTSFKPADAGSANYRELYWRFYVKRNTGWVGNGAQKLTRATIFTKSDWSQAMIAHGWTYDSDDRYLMLDPARGTDANGNVITVGYNDFNHLQWLGGVKSAATEEDQAHVGVWACYEYHVKLNVAGQKNGVFDFKVNGQISAQKTGMDWVGPFNAYGLNAILLENFMNNGAPAANVRVFDNFVVSTQPIGCLGSAPPPVPPGDATAPTVTISSPTTASTYSTTASSVTVSGSASDNVGVTQVRWTNSRGGSGTASGTSSWSASIPLQTNSNVLTVTAQDAAGNVASKTLTVTMTTATATATKLSMTTQPPSNATIGLGLSPQPSVQLRDASNNAVSRSGVVVSAAIATGGGSLGGTLTATTNSSGVASFSNLSISGSDGSRTLQFAASGLTSVTSSSIMATSPAPPPSGSAACTNEPAGYTVVNEQPFDVSPTDPKNLSYSSGWIDDHLNAAQLLKVVNDPTSLYPSSNHNVVQGLFKGGFGGGSAPWFVWTQFTKQFRNIYMCMYVQHSANWDNTGAGINGGTKFVWPAADQVQGTMNFAEWEGNAMGFGFMQQGPVDRKMQANVNSSASDVGNRRGKWVKYEWLLKASSSNSAADGGLDIWIDGVKTHHYTDVRWQMNSNRTWLSLAWNPTYGWGFGNVPHDQYENIDHIRVSGGNTP